MDYLEQRRKLRQMVQERLDYGRDYTDEEVEDTIDEVLMEQENLELCLSLIHISEPTRP